MIKKLFALILLALLLAVGLGLYGWVRYQEFLEPYPAGAPGRTTAELSVAPGTSAQAILNQLEQEGVISSAQLAKYYLVYVLGDPSLQAGDYSFELPVEPDTALRKLIEGDVVLERVTIIEGLTWMETATHLASQGFGDIDALRREMQRTALIEDLDPKATSLEGYLFPDTYSFPKRATEREVVQRLVANFRDQAAHLLAGADAKALVTLASIVEKEATLDQERPLIAGVYAHRLRRGIGLYADPTLIYGKKIAGTWNGNLTKSDLRTDGPYNTYTRGGLPPGPICSPGRASLEAAAAPPEVPYLYFVSRNDGSHVFAESLAEHNRNVERWQRQYWRDQRAEERAKGSTNR